MWDPSGDSSTQIAGNVIALVVPGAGLPFVAIQPLIEGSDWSTKAMNQSLRWAVKANRIVQFEGVPEFDTRFIVSAPEERGKPAVHSALTPAIRHRMSGLHEFTIHAGGDVLAMSTSRVTSDTSMAKVETINREISEVSSLFREMCVARDSLKN